MEKPENNLNADDQTAGDETKAESTENMPEAKEEIDIEALKAELEKERSMASHYMANWQRSQADFINYKRRVEQEKSDLQKFGSAVLILRLLTILDDMERAFATIPTELAGFSWFQGMYLIYRKLLAELESQGLAEIQAEGQEFDPNQHEAVLFGEGEEGRVVSVLQKGYNLHGKVIRPAMVKVGQGTAETETGTEDTTKNNEEPEE